MKKIISCFLLFIAACYLSSCDEETSESGNTTVDSSSLKPAEPIQKEGYKTAHGFEQTWDFEEEDQKLISITDKLALGSGYKVAEQLLPNFKGVRAENKSAELASKGFTEGISETTLFGQKATCTFHFKEDSLKAYEIEVPIMDLKLSDKKYNEIKDFYSHKYGAAESPDVEEDNYTKNLNYWKTNKGYIVLINDLSTGQLKFGRQESKPK
jgi:hypothetical protein